jgi:hypothetical protein
MSRQHNTEEFVYKDKLIFRKCGKNYIHVLIWEWEKRLKYFHKLDTIRVKSKNIYYHLADNFISFVLSKSPNIT